MYYTINICLNYVKVFKPLLILLKLWSLLCIPQRGGGVDNNLGPNCLEYPKALDPSKCRHNQTCDCTTFVWKSQLCMVLSFACFWVYSIPPIHTINVTHLTKQQLVQLLNFDAVMLNIELITFLTPSRCARCYAKNAGY